MPPSQPILVLPNLKKRFSGITSTILQVLPELEKECRMEIFGHALPGRARKPLTRRELFALAAPGRPPVLFHARRNIDMVWGLLFRDLLRRNLRCLFTSVAQRPHTRFTRFLYGRMDRLLSTSERSASYLVRKPDAIIPHGTDIGRYLPAGDRQAAWRESGLPGKFGIGIFGRVRPNKGHREFISALCEILPRYPDFTAVVIGETTPKYQTFEGDLRARVADHGLESRVCFLGSLPFGELPSWFRRLSLVAAVPHNEGFGLTCLEAMASGVPVVATRTGGFEMVIREGTDGRLIPCADTPALVNALDSLLQNPEALQEMGIHARRRIEEHFTAEREARRLLEQYRSLLHSH